MDERDLTLSRALQRIASRCVEIVIRAALPVLSLLAASANAQELFCKADGLGQQGVRFCKLAAEDEVLAAVIGAYERYWLAHDAWVKAGETPEAYATWQEAERHVKRVQDAAYAIGWTFGHDDTNPACGRNDWSDLHAPWLWSWKTLNCWRVFEVPHGG